MLSTLKKGLRRFDRALERFLFRHRYLGFLAVFIGMPLATLGAVYAGAAAIILPLAWAFGLS